LKTEWFGNIRGDVLAGLVVALALIPEAIAFSIIAGVDSKVGLYASFSIAVVVAIDLLLMGAYGHSRIRNLIIGSTTTSMIRSCKIPVLLFR